jgi:hypothetical protein
VVHYPSAVYTGPRLGILHPLYLVFC